MNAQDAPTVEHEHTCRDCGTGIACSLPGCDATGPTTELVWEGGNADCPECDHGPGCDGPLNCVCTQDVYVIATFTASTGGFDWFLYEPTAVAFHAAQLNERIEQHVRYVGKVAVPANLDSEGITAWLDSEGFELWNVEPADRTMTTGAGMEMER